MKRITILLLCLIFGTSFLYAQPDLLLKMHGVSSRIAAENEADLFRYSFTGLQNVGVGTEVYLSVMNREGALGDVNWTIPTKPEGSNATMGGTQNEGDNTQFAAFTPDLAGKYVIEVFSDGAIAEITVNAAMYLGALTEQPNCGYCHEGITAKWKGTGHYFDTEWALNGELSSHFRESCLECHSTGYDPNPTAVNNGFDDFEFVFPEELAPGVWDAMVETYPEAMSRARVQCEACHGPGGNHFYLTQDARMVSTIEVDVCASCHDQGTHHYFPREWEYSVHAQGPNVGYAGGRAGCANCHSGSGFVAYVKGGQVPLTEAPPATVITCATCHDPHSAENPAQVRLSTAQLSDGTDVPLSNEGRLCINCHKGRRDAVDYTDNWLSNLSSHFGPHYGTQGDVLVGANVITWGYQLGTSPHLQAIEKACIGCHMAPAGEDGEGNPLIAGSHTFSMRTPEGMANVAACEPCHGDVGDDFNVKKLYINGIADHDGDGVEEGLQEEVHGLLEQIYELLPNDGEGHLMITDSSVTQIQAQAAYNFLVIEDDRSLGMHNPEFVVDLLQLTLGVLNGTISDVEGEELIPFKFTLEQNYPNPFNPATTIRFNVPQASDVKLTIYDTMGREVEVLVNRHHNPGQYEYNWNAGNFASGVYFYRMEAGNFVKTNKMLLLK